MSFSNVGTVGSSTATSFSITPTSTSNWYLLSVLAGFPASSSTSWATSLSATNITWSTLVAHQAFTASIGQQTIFIGQATSTSAANTAITFNTGTPGVRTAWQQFSNTSGFAAVTLDASGTVDLASSGHHAAVTPTRAGDLYWDHIWDTVTGANGSTSGFTYQNDTSGNPTAYNLNCANSTQTPNIGNTDGTSGMGVMLYENIPSAPNVPIVSPSAAAHRAASW